MGMAEFDDSCSEGKRISGLLWYMLYRGNTSQAGGMHRTVQERGHAQTGRIRLLRLRLLEVYFSVVDGGVADGRRACFCSGRRGLYTSFGGR